MPGFAALTRRHVLPSILAAGLLASPATVRAQAPVEPPAAPAPHHPPLSAASAVLIVEPRRASDGSSIPESDAQLQRRIQTHVATIASEHHMRRVVSDSAGDVRRTQWFRESNDVNERAAWLRDHARVAAVPGTSLIEIALPDVKDPNERRMILQSVGGVYLDAAGAPGLRDRAAVLLGLRDKAKTRLTMLTGEMQRVQLKLNGDGGVGGRIGAKEVELSKLVGEQIDAGIKAATAQAEYEGMQAALQQGQGVPRIEEQAKRNAPYLQADEQNLQQVEVELSLSREQFGPNNPKVLSLTKRLEVMRAALAKKKDAVLASARAAIVEEAKASAAAANAKAEGLNKRVETLKGELGDLSSAMLALQSLHEEERGLRQQIKVVQGQIDNVVESQGSPGRGSDVHWHLLPEAAPR
jgi:hypothetical protein